MPGYPDVTITYVVCVHGWRQAAHRKQNMPHLKYSSQQTHLKHVQSDHLEYSSQQTHILNMYDRIISNIQVNKSCYK